MAKRNTQTDLQILTTINNDPGRSTNEIATNINSTPRWARLCCARLVKEGKLQRSWDFAHTEFRYTITLAGAKVLENAALEAALVSSTTQPAGP